MELSPIILNIFNIFLMSPIAYYAWRIGKTIGFSRPWKMFSIGFVLAIIGAIIRIFGYIYVFNSTPTLLDIGIGFNIASYSLILIGIFRIYKILIGSKKT